MKNNFSLPRRFGQSFWLDLIDRSICANEARNNLILDKLLNSLLATLSQKMMLIRIHLLTESEINATA
jgi:hypothetical protein